MDNQNRKRGLSDVVGVEAWHVSFDESLGVAGLHIDVVFQTGRLGGNPQDRVRFKLGLKKASVIVVVPPGEPARVDTRSVIRDSPVSSGQIIQKVATAHKAGASLGLNADAGVQPNLAGSLDLEVGVSGERERNLQLTESISHMKVVHMKNEEQFHRWLISPTVSRALDGRPWDSRVARLNLIDTRKRPTRAMAPTVRIEVRCMIEDLEITEIALKDQTAWNRVLAGPNHRNKMAAAEAYIRNRLYKDGLIDGSLNDGANGYAEITIAATIAES